MRSTAARTLIVMFVVASLVGGTGSAANADGDVERRIADFWKRVDALGPADHLSAVELGQWALNVTDRDAKARITLSDFRASTAVMQTAIERARVVPPVAAPTPSTPGVEQRIADFWKRLSFMRLGDYLSTADLGQWALNLIDRDSTARLTVADFRASTAGMQTAIERAGVPMASITWPARLTEIPGRPGYRPLPDCDASSTITYEFTPAVSPAYREAIKEGSELAARYIKHNFGDTMCGVKIGAWSYAAGDKPPAGIGGIGFSCCQPLTWLRSSPAQRTFWLDVSHRVLSTLDGAAAIATHSYFNLWNDWLGCFYGQPGSTVFRNAPVWYQVGFAAYLDGEAKRDTGAVPPIEYYLSEAKLGIKVLPLRDLEAEHPLDNERNRYKIQLGYVAFSQLVARSGLPATIEFCRRVGQGAAWETSFSTIFGLSAASFYQQFEAYLARP